MLVTQRLLYCLVLACLCCAAIDSSDERGRVLLRSDWIIRPDPPSTDQDLTATYVGDPDAETASYSIDGGPVVNVDLKGKMRIRIPKAKLRGKSFVRFHAKGGGEDGIRVVHLAKSR